MTFVKWITCEVPSADRQRFSEAQERWAPIAREPGFICQIGGWDERSPTSACIVALWHDPDAHARFMHRHHDTLLAAAWQAGTYRSLQVATGSVTGVFSHLDEHRYLVATGWRDHASHEEYRRDRLPALAERAAPTDDLRRLSGYVVHVSEAWTVTAAAP